MKKNIVFAAICFIFANLFTSAALPQTSNEKIAFSLSGSGDLASYQVSKEEILIHDKTAGTRLLFSNEGIAFLTGDLNKNGIEDFPGNINALHFNPSNGNPDPSDILFSASTNCCGVKDGDVVSFCEPEGLSVFMSESYFVTATGATDGNVDVDAFTIAPSGWIYFSFADNEKSSILSGSQPGVILDGAIIALNPAGGASIFYTEEDVSALVSHALGANISAGDLMGLTFDPTDNCLLFSVQSPSSHDASVFSDANQGEVVPDHDESLLGFASQVEMDALSLLPVFEDVRSLQIDPRYPASGDTIAITINGGAPFGIFFLLISGAKSTALPGPFYNGFGSILLDMNHSFFISGLMGIVGLSGQLDVNGVGTIIKTLPVDPYMLDFHIQAFEPLNRALSHPMTLEMNQ